MKHTKFTRNLLCLVLAVLLAAACTLTGCSNQTAPTETPATEAPATDAPATEAPQTSATEIGEGEITFTFDVTFRDGSTQSYAVHTSMPTVGGALVDNGLIEGDVGEYGLYVTTVCGESLDWEADQMYWAFYENGEYAMQGVDTTEIAEGATYSFVATAG